MAAAYVLTKDHSSHDEKYSALDFILWHSEGVFGFIAFERVTLLWGGQIVWHLGTKSGRSATLGIAW